MSEAPATAYMLRETPRHERLPTYKEDPVAADLESTAHFAEAGAHAVGALWGWSHEATTQTEHRYLSAATMVDADTETLVTSTRRLVGMSDVTTQMSPMVVAVLR